MNILFVHQNFPAQYANVLRELLCDPGVRIAAVGSQSARAPRGCMLRKYKVADADVASTHPFARRFDLEARRAEQVLYALMSLKAEGFVPDVILAHPGWGETLPLRTAFPRARIIVYCEFYYGNTGRDVGFDAEFPASGVDGHVALHIKNASTLLALAEADCGVSPTAWQRSTFPARYREHIHVSHEGVDIDRIRPDPDAAFVLPSGSVLRATDEVVTFVARNLEPQRGYHVFMRSLPALMARRPKAQIVIVGGDGVSYGAAPPAGQTWKSIFLNEVVDRIDGRRIHFTGRLNYANYLRVLQVSSAHVYLTYPFVLSWSVLEAMSAGCLVIGSDTEPLRDAIDGRNGMLVPFFDVDHLAGTVAQALARPDRYTTMRAAARQSVVERYDVRRRCLPQLMTIIRG